MLLSGWIFAFKNEYIQVSDCGEHFKFSEVNETNMKWDMGVWTCFEISCWDKHLGIVSNNGEES